MVAVGRVRVEDRIGNDLADRAADFGRRRVSDLVMDVRRRFCFCLFFLVSCLFWSFIPSLLLLLVPRLMRMGALGSLCILLFGLVAV